MFFVNIIVQATFNQRSNEYLLSYVYLAAPISLAIVNPLGFALLEYQKAKDEAISTPKYETVTNKNRVLIRKIVFNTVKGIVTNPFVFMIVFGIAFNFILEKKLPIWADGLFKTLANAYGATALFYLGWKLGNNPVKVKGMELVVPIILVSVKGYVCFYRLSLPYEIRRYSHSLQICGYVYMKPGLFSSRLG